MPDFTVLLPPAKKKQTGGNPFAPDMFDYRSSNTFNFFSQLNPDRRKLIDKLQEVVEAAEENDLQKLFDVSEDELEEVLEIDREVMDSPLISALDRYSLDPLYEAMDFQNLPTGAQRRMLENGIIISGLFGLLRPDDLIPNYVLPLEAELPELGRVGEYWHSRITPVLNKSLEGQFVWDFLDESSRKVWDDQHTYEKLVRVSFEREDESGNRVPVTEDTAELRGQLVGFIVDDAADTVEDLNDWDHPEYFQVDPEVSSYDEESKIHHVVMVPMERPEPEEELEE